MGVSGFGRGPDEEAADGGVVRARAGFGTGRGFAAVKNAGSEGIGVGPCGVSPVEGGGGGRTDADSSFVVFT